MPMSPRRITTRVPLAALAIVLSACSDRAPAQHDRDLKLLPPSPAPPPQAIPSVRVPSGGHCIPVPPGPLRLSGTLAQEQRLGPPGYGESPDKDEHLTIYLLDLREPFMVCALDDRARVSNTVHRIKAMQLNGNVDPGQIRVGATVTVFGTVEYQEASHDFTEVVVRVDSIPALRPPRATPST